MQPEYRGTIRREGFGRLPIGLTRGAVSLAVAALSVGTVVLASRASAQATESTSVIVDIGACLEIESPESRFQCYERIAEEAKQSRAVLPNAPGGRDEPLAQSARDSVETGSQATSPATEAPPDTAAGAAASATEQPDEIRSVITELREMLPSTYLISLENGQIWRQTHARAYRITPGMAVRIYPTRGSSYRLSATDLNGFIQVERVR